MQFTTFKIYFIVLHMYSYYNNHFELLCYNLFKQISEYLQIVDVNIMDKKNSKPKTMKMLIDQHFKINVALFQK